MALRIARWYKVENYFINSRKGDKTYCLTKGGMKVRVTQIGRVGVVDGIRQQTVTTEDNVTVTYSSLAEETDWLYGKHKVHLCDKDYEIVQTFSWVRKDPLIKFTVNNPKNKTTNAEQSEITNSDAKKTQNRRSKKSAFAARNVNIQNNDSADSHSHKPDSSDSHSHKPDSSDSPIPSHSRFYTTSAMKGVQSVLTALRMYPNNAAANSSAQDIANAIHTDRFDVKLWENAMSTALALSMGSQSAMSTKMHYKHFPEPLSKKDENNSNNSVKPEKFREKDSEKKNENNSNNSVKPEIIVVKEEKLQKIEDSHLFCVGCAAEVTCFCHKKSEKQKKKKCICAKHHWGHQTTAIKDAEHLAKSDINKCIFCGASFPNKTDLAQHDVAMHSKDKRKTQNTQLKCTSLKCPQRFTAPKPGKVTYGKSKVHKCNENCEMKECKGPLYVAQKKQWNGVAKLMCRRCKAVRAAANETEKDLLNNSIKTKQELNTEYQTNVGVKCPYCGKELESKEDLVTHLQEH